MPKSASTLLCELTRNAVLSKFGEQGQKALNEAIAKGALPGHGAFVDQCSNKENLLKLQALSEEHGPFVVKAHSPLTDPLKLAIEQGHVQVSYIYRDPRDAMLSAMANFEATKYSDRIEFKGYETFGQAMDKYLKNANDAIKWKESGLSTVLQYESFIKDLSFGLKKVLTDWGILLRDEEIASFVKSASDKQKSSGWNLRLNKGISGRFRDVFTEKELIEVNNTFTMQLQALGYKT